MQRGNTTIRNNSVNAGTSLATLDLSGLSAFISGSNATFNVGGTGSEARSAGQLVLAAVSNNITVGTLNLQTTSGNGGNNGGAANIRLGAGTNIINAGTINLVAGKVVSGTMSFQGATGGLRVRGGTGNTDNTSRATITICNRNSGGTGAMNGTADFIGHSVDIRAGTIAVGQAGSNPSSAGQNGTANFRFNAGTVDATTINIANNTVANANTTGNLEIGAGGSLTVSNISLVNQTAGSGSGNLFIGGAVTCLGGVTKTTAAGVGNITITNGSISIPSGKSIGAAGVPIDNLTLNTSTMTLPASAASANVVVNNLNINGATDTINVSAVPGLGQFPLISYTTLAAGTLDFTLGTMAIGFQGYISNNVAANSVDVVVTNSIIKTDVSARKYQRQLGHQHAQLGFWQPEQLSASRRGGV